jgi:hypothetical protein
MEEEHRVTENEIITLVNGGQLEPGTQTILVLSNGGTVEGPVQHLVYNQARVTGVVLTVSIDETDTRSDLFVSVSSIVATTWVDQPESGE